MSPAQAARSLAAPTITERNSRPLSQAETRVRNWIKKKHGVLSRIKQKTGYSVQYISRIAYNQQGTKSKGLVVERALRDEGCPLIQKLQ